MDDAAKGFAGAFAQLMHVGFGVIEVIGIQLRNNIQQQKGRFGYGLSPTFGGFVRAVHVAKNLQRPHDAFLHFVGGGLGEGHGQNPFEIKSTITLLAADRVELVAKG